MKKPTIALLQKMPIFGGLNTDSLQLLLELSPVITITSGNFFFREYELGGSMFVLEDGKVAILKSWEGNDHLLAYLAKGDCFGEMEMMNLCPRVASVMAVTDCTALQISKASLFHLYEKDLEQFTLIQMNMGREVSRRLRTLDQELFEKNVKENVAIKKILSHQDLVEQEGDRT